MDESGRLDRFLRQQDADYPAALAEVRRGRKESHWMWYIFPQLRGLGRSTMAWYYGIEDLREAGDYLAHPVLGQRLREITRAAVECGETDAAMLFGRPDDMKFRSCMTLFAQASGDDLFDRALERFFDGRPDPVTLQLLRQKKDGDRRC